MSSSLIVSITFLWATAGCEFATEFQRKNIHDPQSAIYEILPPTAVSAEISDEAVIKITWKDNSMGETGFLVERKIDNSDYQAIKTTPPNTEILFDSTTAFGSFRYRVTALTQRSKNRSDSSNVLLVTHWSPGPAMNISPSPSYSLTTVRLKDGRILASSIDHCEVYRPDTKQWINVGGLRIITQGLKTVVLNGGRVFGLGTDGDSSTPNPGRLHAELFDPSTLNWNSLGYLTDSLAYDNLLTVTALSNGEALICGIIFVAPYPPSSLISVTKIYSPNTNAFRATSDMTVKRFAHSAVTLFNQKVLVAGGYEQVSAAGTGTPTRETELFDPSTEKWVLVAPSNQFHAYQNSLLMSDGKAFFIGGAWTEETYDPSADSWSYVGTPPRHQILQSVLLSDGSVLALLVPDIGPTLTYSYNSLDGTWTNLGVFPGAGDVRVAALDNKRVLAVETTGKIWIFRP